MQFIIFCEFVLSLMVTGWLVHGSFSQSWILGFCSLMWEMLRWDILYRRIRLPRFALLNNSFLEQKMARTNWRRWNDDTGNQIMNFDNCGNGSDWRRVASSKVATPDELQTFFYHVMSWRLLLMKMFAILRLKLLQRLVRRFPVLWSERESGTDFLWSNFGWMI